MDATVTKNEADELRETVAAHATRAAEKLRQHGLVAGQIAAFFHTSPHRDPPHHHGQRSARLVPMTADTREIVGAALRCVEAAWRGGRGCRYVKAGVLLDDLCRPEDAPPALFAAPSPRSDALMAAMGQVNAKFGRDASVPAAIGIERGWKLRAAHHSPRYTTRLDEASQPILAPVEEGDPSEEPSPKEMRRGFEPSAPMT